MKNATLTHHSYKATHTHTQQDSPTFPLYTEVMGKGKSEASEAEPEEGEESPKMSQKQLMEEETKELNLSTAEEIPTVPKQNLSAEDMQLMGLSPDSEVMVFVC